jgi:O-antigen/teichoic acid export membrane protein
MAARAGMSRFARNSTLIGLAGLASALTNFASTVLIARILGVDGTGVVSFAVWLASMVVVVGDLGVSISVGRFLPELRASGRGNEADQLAGWLLRRLALASCLLPAAALGMIWVFFRGGSAGGFAQATSGVWALTALLCFVQTFSGFGAAYLQGTQQFARAAVLAFAGFAVQMIVLAAGCVFFGAEGALVGYISGLIVMATATLAAVRRHAEVATELRRRVVRYATYSWVTAIIAAFVYSRLELFFLERFVGSTGVALFAVGLTLSSLATQGPVLMTRGTFFYFAEQLGGRDRSGMQARFETGTRLIALLVLPSCFVAAGVMPLLLPMIYGPSFTDAVPVASILMIASAVVAIGTIASNLLLALERNDFVLYCGAAAAAVSVAFGLTLVPTFGAIGAAAGRAIVQVLLLVAGSWYLAKRFGFRLPLVSLGKMLLAGLCCALVARLLSGVQIGVAALPVAIAGAAVTYLAIVRVTGALPASDVALLQSKFGSLHRRFLARAADPHIDSSGR